MTSEAAAYLPEAMARAKDVDVPVSASPRVVALSIFEADAVTTKASSATERYSDEDLLLEVSNGSREALSILFKRHARAIFNVAKRILRDNSEAEDLVQDLFLFFFQKARAFNPEKGTATSWIIQMAYHRAIDRRRYLTARHHYDATELDEGRHHADVWSAPIDEITARTLLSRLRDELSTEQRQTLELHFFEGYTFLEIANKTGQTLGNVRHHYYRGLERLRSYIFPGKAPSK